MTDVFDRATEREEQFRDDALRDQRRRASLSGKTVEDSALLCRVCDEKIPLERRRAIPGVQTCVECQQDLERATDHRRLR